MFRISIGIQEEIDGTFRDIIYLRKAAENQKDLDGILENFYEQIEGFIEKNGEYNG